MGGILITLDSLFGAVVGPLLISYVILGLDDLFVDVYSWIRGLHPLAIPTLRPDRLHRKSEKRLAVTIAAWREHDVIARMIRGNTDRIRYSNYVFFIGVYPNDHQTLAAVQTLAATHPQVRLILNSQPGPTSKGQMLNQIIHAIIGDEKRTGEIFDGIVIHDCEDLIHPYALLAISDELDRADFVQIPVFSLPLPAHEIIAGTYMDEFAESHTKDMRVRNALSSIPSAGVGTAIARNLILKYMSQFSGHLFNELSLTEDYELGLRTRQLAAKSSFLLAKYKGDIIATREYFPRRFRGSIRQKTRWSVGIVYQGTRNLGWARSWGDNFFLFRDRKAPISNLVNFSGFLLFIYGLIRTICGVDIIGPAYSEIYVLGAMLTLNLMCNRLIQRALACGRIYGVKSIILVPIRTMAGNIINALASLNAFKQVLLSKVLGIRLRWVKTDHELPLDFGSTPSKPASARVLTLAFFLYLGLWSPDSKSAAVTASATPTRECVQIYYDMSPDPNYRMGEIYAIFLQNLLAHFPKYQQIVKPIELYTKGELDQCHASFYIGSYFENAIPQAFYDDFVVAKKSIVWLGYSVWKLGPERLKQALGAEYLKLTTLDTRVLDPQQRPTFFKFIKYKDETFYKYGEFSKTKTGPRIFQGPFEMAAMRRLNSDTEILAEATHNGSQEKLPYILRQGPRFYFADVPLSFMHEADRYLIFADVLFDILDEKPLYPAGRPAVFRLEDLQAKTPQYRVYILMDLLKRLNVPLNVALIPIFYDPLNRTNRGPQEEIIFLGQDPLFMQLLQDLKRQNASFVWHGVTHQYREIPNPHDAVSGNDFEFWNTKTNGPLAEDSVPYILNRLDDGWRALSHAQITPDIWETPHYQASPLDYQIFAKLFSWNIGRVIYYPTRTVSLDFASDLRFRNLGTSGYQARLAAFEQFSKTASGIPAGQFFPYEIYGDVYGQRLIPENLGNPQPYESNYVLNPRSIDDLLALARRNIKLRDVWGSLFFHPQLVDPYYGEGMGSFPGDTHDLERVILEMRKMGYEFIHLKDFAESHKDIIRKPSRWTPTRRELNL